MSDVYNSAKPLIPHAVASKFRPRWEKSSWTTKNQSQSNDKKDSMMRLWTGNWEHKKSGDPKKKQKIKWDVSKSSDHQKQPNCRNAKPNDRWNQLRCFVWVQKNVYYIILYYVILYYNILYYVILYYIIIYHIILCYIILWYVK
jgi:hypothetical protein